MAKLPSRARLALVALGLVAATVAAPSHAARYHVMLDGQRNNGASTPDDWSLANCYPTLAAALAAAAPADSVLLARETHAVTGDLALAVALLADRELAAGLQGAVLDLGNTGALSLPAAQPALEVRGLALVGDGQLRALPALRASSPAADLAVTGCEFGGFVAPADGAAGGSALRVVGPATVAVTGTSFSDNVCHGRGGAVFLGSGITASFEGCTWLRNSALVFGDARGGAVMVDARSVLSTVEFSDCIWRENTSGGPGGAVATLSAAVTLEDCEVHDSSSGVENGWSAGAGLHLRRNASDHVSPTPVVVRRCLFTGNRGYPNPSLSAGDGGAMAVNGGSIDQMVEVLVEDSEFRENFNLQGAGVYVSRYAEGTVRRCRFYDNIAYYHAGGVFKGGQFDDSRGETLDIDSCLFVRNLAGFTADGQPEAGYCRGGAIVCRMFPRVIVRHCTFIENRINDPGYHFGDAFAHYFEYGEWTPEMLCVLQNCVFWGENGVDVQAWSSDGGMALAEHNAAAEGELDLGGVEQVGTVTLATSPFVDLEEGYPLAGGPLIDAGVELFFVVDIDGNPMPVGDAPDIGCYEWRPASAAPDLPAAVVDLTAGPNPFNPRTVLRCRLDVPAGVSLTLHDARGQVVRRLWAGPLAVGEHRWAWDGRDEGGRECASGLYLARLRVGDGREAVRKLMLVR